MKRKKRTSIETNLHREELVLNSQFSNRMNLNQKGRFISNLSYSFNGVWLVFQILIKMVSSVHRF